MNRYIYIFLMFAGLAHAESMRGYHLDMVESTDRYILCDVTFDSVAFAHKYIDGKWYTQVRMPGCAYLDFQNLPQLPKTSLVLGIPPSGTPSISIETQNIITKSIGEILPVKLPVEDYPSIPVDYRADSWFPDKIVQTGVIGFARDQRILQIELSPVRYLAGAKLTQFVKSIRLKITFENVQPFHPVQVDQTKFEATLKSNLANYESGRQWRSIDRATANDKPEIQGIDLSSSVKIVVEKDGVYAVSGVELERAGVNIGSIDPKTLSMTNRGISIPLLIEGYADGLFDPNDRIIFIGEHNKGDLTYLSWYSDKNIYWLSWGGRPGARFADLIGSPDPAVSDTLTFATGLIHLEQDKIYSRLTYYPREDKDHWFWYTLNIGDDEYPFEFTTPDVYTDGWVQIRVGLHGQTHPPGSPDHHVVIKLNDLTIGDVKWDEQSPYEFVSDPIAASFLKDRNRITCVLPGDLPNTTVDQVMLNYIDIEYDRRLLSTNDSLTFATSEHDKILRARGFRTDEIYIFTKSGYRITYPTIVRKKDTFDYIFTNRSTVPTTFYLTGKSTFKSVSEIEKTAASDLKNKANGADYIIITHRNFQRQAQRISDYRSAQGFRTKIADIFDIYNEFNHGIYDPRAIKNFLKYAYFNWTKPAPLYVLLLGDTTHKMDKKIAEEDGLASYVPTMMLYTHSWGMTSSDNYFVSVNGDDELPDMYIGRLPANTDEEARIMIDKVIQHETNSDVDEWRRHVLMLTGTGDFFEQSADYLRNTYVPESMITDWVATLPTSKYFGSTEDVAHYINNGETIINFIGHGGGGMFSDADLFDLQDIERLMNHNKFPIAFSLTCFIGHFDNDEQSSLAEGLLLAPGGGIVANFGSSGRAYLMGNYYLNNALFDAIFLQDMRDIGAIITEGKIGMVNLTRGYWDHVKNYNLLGDPATRLYTPSEIVNVKLSKSLILDNDILKVTGKVNGYNSGTVVVTIYDESDSLLMTKQVAVENGVFSVDMLAMDAQTRKIWGDDGGMGRVRVYFSNGQYDGVGYADFNVNRPFVSDITITPSQPVHLDSVYFTAILDSASMKAAEGIESVQLKWSANYREWFTMTMEKLDEVKWRSPAPVVNMEGTTVYYQVIVNCVNGSKIETKEFSFMVQYRSDLFVQYNSVQVFGNSDIGVSAVITNSGGMDAGPFNVKVFSGDTLQTSKPVSPLIHIPGLKATQDTLFTFHFEGAKAGLYNLIFWTDTENQVNEANKKNNITERAIRITTKSEGTGGPVYSTLKNYWINITGESIEQNTFVDFKEFQGSDFVEAARLSSLVPIRLLDDYAWKVYGFEFADSSISSVKPVEVGVYYEKNDSLSQTFALEKALRIYVWNKNGKTWQGLPSTIDVNKGVVRSELPPGAKMYSLLASNDVEGPVIQVNLEGQSFADGDIVRPRPTFTFIIEDTSGFDFERTPVFLSLNNEPVQETEFNIYQDPGARRQATVTFPIDVKRGNHEIMITAVDLNGNKTEAEYTFSVAGEFKLASIANHPNPFTDITTVAFTLLDIAEEVKLDIYTVSGRLIQSKTLQDISGYYEWDWDTLDRDGNPIANGVYYLKFTAKKGDKKIETIEKLAKLE
ncbi:T9SS type A sorting domain-containing protein [candidate division KSB1 bacterium]|nr:T9SS type A sorting domain-containing protein [candidate division KSB1 bacterium]